MKRREFIKNTAEAGAVTLIGGRYIHEKPGPGLSEDVSYNKLPLWKGFNLQEKFTHKPDEWLDIAPEWGAKNEPFRETDFVSKREI